MVTKLASAAVLITAVNLPFGYWRAGVRKLSTPWFLAVHLPVLLVVGIRLLLGVPFVWWVLPITVGSFALGQWFGGRWRKRRSPG